MAGRESESPGIEDRLVNAKGEDEEARLRRKLLSKRPSEPPDKPEKKRKKDKRHSPVRAPEPKETKERPEAKSPNAGPSRRVAVEADEEEGFAIQPLAQEKEKRKATHKEPRHRERKRDRYDKDLRPSSPRRDDRHRDRRAVEEHHDRRSTSAHHHHRGREVLPPSREPRGRRPPPPPRSDREGRDERRREGERRREDPARSRERSRDRRMEREEPRLRDEEREEEHIPRSPPLPEGERLPPRNTAALHEPADDSGSSPGSSAGASAESGELSAEEGEKRRPNPERSPEPSPQKAEEGEEKAEEKPEEAPAPPPRRSGKSKFESSSESEGENDEQEPQRSPLEPLESANGVSPPPKNVDELIDDLQDSGPEGEGDEDPNVVPTRLLPIYYAGISGCRSVEEFHCLNRIEEGTYGVVYRAKEKRTDEVVALKRLKMEKEKEGFPITSLREINMLLKAGGHENVVNIREIVVGTNMDKIYLCMDYVEHDMKALMESMKQPFLIGEVKTLLRQLLAGIHHLHDNWILHRDLKTSNLLLSHTGELKIGDFGLAREYGSPIKPYTPIVVTLWYRAPELLLGIKEYATAIDMWSVGCIFAEFLTLKPMFPGRGELDELNRIFKVLGTPSEKIWPGYDRFPAHKTMSFVHYPYNQLRKHFDNSLSDAGISLMNKFLTYNPEARITAKDGMKHAWFSEDPQPVPKEMFPTWPAKSELKAAPKAAPRGKLAPSPPKAPSPGKSAPTESEESLLRKAMNLKPIGGSSFALRFDAPKFT